MTLHNDHSYIAGTYARYPVVLSHGRGCEVWDDAGQRYLDFTSGIGVNSLGWAHPLWQQAVSEQAGRLQHTSNLFYSAPMATLAKTLCQSTGMQKVFFANSGAEANEGAIKLARKYARDRYGDQRPTIITLLQSFHGRTISTLAATGQAHFHQHFHPFTPCFEHLPANDMDALCARVSRGDVSAILVELVQGEGGLTVLSSEYVQGVQALCRAHDILLMVDEVQTGIGRTGRLLASQHYDLQPDVITLAKGLGGGLPIGAVLMGQRCAQTLGVGDHGSTFGGNPVCCAGALAVLNALDEPTLAHVRSMGERLQAGLATLPGVHDISGLGLMIGFCVQGMTPAQVVHKAMQQGLLLLTAKHKVRLLPALVVNATQVDEALTVLENVLTPS